MDSSVFVGIPLPGALAFAYNLQLAQANVPVLSCALHETGVIKCYQRLGHLDMESAAAFPCLVPSRY